MQLVLGPDELVYKAGVVTGFLADNNSWLKAGETMNLLEKGKRTVPAETNMDH